MQALYIHISSLAGLIVFIGQMMRFASIERTLLTGISSALAVYVVLTFAGVFVRKIIAQSEEAADAAAKENQQARAGETEPASAA